MKTNQISTVFGLLTLLFFVVVYGYSIFTDGMFFDGVFYAAIAKNYAEGFGSFWEMHYTSTLHSSFHEQPPLVLFLQSIFFRALGDSIYVERIYDLVFTLLTIVMMMHMWKEISGKDKHPWLPVLMWLIIPLTIWTYQNNLIEVTMGFLDLCAIFFILRGCREDSKMALMLGGLFTFLAFFSKGFQGLFPLAAPLIYWLIYRNRNLSQSIMHTLMVVTVPVILMGILLTHPAARNFYDMYLERRLGGSFNHLQDTTASHFYLLQKLFLELLVPVGLGVVFWLWSGRTVRSHPPDYKAVLVFLAIGFSASLPLMITLEQRPFYLATSLPYFVMAISLFVLPYVDAALDKVKTRNVSLVNYSLAALVIVGLVFVMLNAGKPKREHELIENLAYLRQEIPERSTISISPDLDTKWSYHAYFMRYNSISLDAHNRHPYYLRRQESPVPQDTCYKEVNLPLKNMVLYKCD